MTDKEKIRAEIERLQDGLMDAQGRFCTNAAESAYHILCHLENFINSMQEESKSKFEQSIQEGDNIVYNEELGCRVNLSQLKRVAKKEEPVSENLEEASEQLAENARKRKAETSSPFFSQTDYKQGVIDGAQWQKEQMIKKAFPVEIGRQRSDYKCMLNGNFSCYNTGDKVKLIIIKED